MTVETLKKIADVTNLEPFAVLKGIQSKHCADDAMEKVYCVYRGELSLMASFFLPSQATKYAEQLAIDNPLWMIILVYSFDTEVKHVQAA